MKFILFFTFIFCLLWTLILVYGFFKLRNVSGVNSLKNKVFVILTIPLSYVISYIIYN